MKKINIAIFIVLYGVGYLCAQVNKQQDITKQPFQIGETLSFHSGVLQEDRSLNIYLPPSYAADSLRSFPVTYLLDGSADEDFIHVVGLVQFATFPWVNSMPESIVVGISNVDRRRDFTFPTTIAADKKAYPTTGGSADFIAFMEQELIPIVQKNYRTNDTTTLVGQSLGGLLGVEVLYKKPDLFANYIIVSPSLWWDAESLLKLEPSISKKPKTVYLTVGGQEPEPMVKDAKTLMDLLAGTGYRRIFNIAEDQGHGNILHLALYDAFARVFSAK